MAQDQVGGECIKLGSYYTAVEAAVAYARHKGPPKEVEGLVKEAEGFRLHLSPLASTGYAGVYLSTEFAVQEWGGGHLNLGTFATAVEAAVAYARHRAKKEKGGKGAPTRAPSAAARRRPPRALRRRRARRCATGCGAAATEYEVRGSSAEDSSGDEGERQPRKRRRRRQRRRRRLAPAPAAAPAPHRRPPAAPALAPCAVPELLARFNLADLYATAFDDEGYDGLPYLLTLDREKLLAVAAGLRREEGHATKFADWTLKHPDGLLPHR